MQFFSNTVLIIGLTQGIFLAFAILLVNKKKHLHNYFLSALLLLFSIVLAHEYLNGSKFFSEHIMFFYVSFLTPLLIGPCLYFYVISLLRKAKFRKIDFLHFLPFLVVFQTGAFVN